MAIGKELQEIRYEHFESKRQDKIKIAKEERKQMIENPYGSLDSKMNSTLKMSHISMEASGVLGGKKDDSTALKMEQERLEKIKRKQVILINNIN